MTSNLPGLTPNCLEAFFPLHYSGSMKFGVVEPPQTHSNLPCRAASPFVTMVPGGSRWFNCPELIRTCPVDFIIVVRGGSVQSNFLQPAL